MGYIHWHFQKIIYHQEKSISSYNSLFHNVIAHEEYAQLQGNNYKGLKKTLSALSMPQFTQPNIINKQMIAPL